MKILEAQNALLSNYEVYQFLTERNEQLGRQKQNRRRGPGNLETLVREYLRSPPSPLGQEPSAYSTGAVRQLVQRLREFDLAKSELLMLLNLRPQTPAQLHACIEEVEDRLGEDQQLQILDIVTEVLGHFAPTEAMDAEESGPEAPAA